MKSTLSTLACFSLALQKLPKPSVEDASAHWTEAQLKRACERFVEIFKQEARTHGVTRFAGTTFLNGLRQMLRSRARDKVRGT